MTEEDSAKTVIRVEPGIGAIDAEQWEACANPPQQAFNPFISHGFLLALEQSGSATAETGWLPRHLVLQDHTGAITGCMPCYLKSHSYGEYVFDHLWCDACHRSGGRYYPKLQVSVPFTPATGPRLLVSQGPGRKDRQSLLASAAVALCRRHEASSLHLTFLTPPEWRLLGEMGFLQRIDWQFHWRNRGYNSFDDFLTDLRSRKRKAVIRERREAIVDGVIIEWITGKDITEAHWDAFFAFYLNTGSRKWGRPYLTRQFFSLLSAAMAGRLLLIMARREGRYVAGALNVIGGDTLFGRYWGASQHHQFLHFEICYYQAMEFAMAHGIKHVEAGAQGQHKLARGYLATPTYSAHFIAERGLADAVSRYLEQERRQVETSLRLLNAHSPFRNRDMAS